MITVSAHSRGKAQSVGGFRPPPRLFRVNLQYLLDPTHYVSLDTVTFFILI